jgi:4-amino-4-deoxy-L-arabinose transferase-like glycosyltransferase
MAVMPIQLRPWRDYGFIVGNALIPIVIVVIALWPKAQQTGWQNYWCDDRYLYDRAATMFGTHGILDDDPKELDAVRDRMPLYPLLLLGLWPLEWLTGIPVPASSIIINTLALAGSACLLFRMVLLGTGSRGIALISALLWPWLPGVVPYTLAQLPEALGTFFFMLASFLLLRASQQEDKEMTRVSFSPHRRVYFDSSAISAGAALGIATLFKPVFCYFSIPSLLLLWLGPQRRWRPLPLFFVAFLVPISLWIARNYIVWGVITLTPNGSAHLANARDAMAAELGLPKRSADLPRNEHAWQQVGIDPADLPARSAYRSQLAWQELRGRLPDCAWVACKSLVKLHGSTGVGTLATMASGTGVVNINDQQPEPHQSPAWSQGWQALHIVCMVLLMMMYVLALCGVFSLWRQPQNRLILLWALLTIGYFVLISVPFGNTRYRYPAMPGYATLAGAGIVSLWNRGRRSTA